MSKPYPPCVKLNQYIHELLFSFAGRSYPDSYFTVYLLDNGERETRLCHFPTNPDGMYLPDYVSQVVESLTSRGRSLTAFAMFLSQENQDGLFDWWSLATDNGANLEAICFVPFVNEDGVYDYCAMMASPKSAVAKEAMQPLFEATDFVWQAACASGAADLEFVTASTEPVAA